MVDVEETDRQASKLNRVPTKDRRTKQVCAQEIRKDIMDRGIFDTTNKNFKAPFEDKKAALTIIYTMIKT